MSEQTTPEITDEMIAAYQRQQAARAEQERRQCIQDIIDLATQRGYRIVAMPGIDADGRLVADWGVTAAK
jgi:hypothetical protein